MPDEWDQRLTTLIEQHALVVAGISGLVPAVTDVARRMCAAFDAGGVLYTFGNGGSAADAQHFTGEVIGHYRLDRRPLPAVTLSVDPTVMSCIANDYSFAEVFGRQVSALVRPVDIVAAFTSSGRSANVVNGLRAAKENGATTVLFSGRDGGPAVQFADVPIVVASDQTARIQEMHTLFLHLISEVLDEWAFTTQGQRPEGGDSG